MKLKTFLITAAMSGGLLVSATLNCTNLKASAQIKSSFDNNYGVTHYTRYEMEQMLSHQNDMQYQMPNFDANQIKNLTSAKDQFHLGEKGEQLDVWDSWPLKTANGEVANFHGYNITFALTGNTNHNDPNDIAHCKIYVFYQKVNDENKGISSWRSAGPVFNSNVEGAKNPSKLLKSEVGEWAGSTLLQNNGRARLFYTSLSGSNGQQTLATASIKIQTTKTGLRINHRQNSDRKLIFAGDGKYYENLQQANEDAKTFTENDHCLRDPNYVEANGHKYLIFDANTGNKFGTVGINQLNNIANLGGDADFQASQQIQFVLNSSLKMNAAYDNAALGIVELNNDYTIKKVMKPLVVFNGVNDEAERPSIIQYQNKWYLFTTTHGWHLTSQNVNADDSFMLGFSSNKLTGGYEPLNDNGLVLHSNKPLSDRTYSYSYGVIQNSHDPFVVNSYMSAIGRKDNGYATFATSVLLMVNGNQTSIMQAPTLSQGQVTYSMGIFAKK